MKNTFLLLLISLVLLGCKKDEIGNAHIEGYVTNLATGDPINNVIVSLIDYDWSSSQIVDTQNSDDNGYFLFNRNYQSFDNHLTLALGNFNVTYIDNYQPAVVVNGVLDSLFFALGVNPQGHSSDPQTYNLELYPITFFKIIVNNIPPASSNDKINITIQNINNGSGIIHNGIENYEYSGSIQNKIISGEAKIGNLISLYYEVTSNGMVNSYHEIKECTPGAMTSFELNY